MSGIGFFTFQANISSLVSLCVFNHQLLIENLTKF